MCSDVVSWLFYGAVCVKPLEPSYLALLGSYSDSLSVHR